MRIRIRINMMRIHNTDKMTAAIKVETVAALEEMISDPDSMRMQALLVRERILGPAHPDTSYYIRYRYLHPDTSYYIRYRYLYPDTSYYIRYRYLYPDTSYIRYRYLYYRDRVQTILQVITSY